jgi:Proteobacterial transcriptional regulator-like domain
MPDGAGWRSQSATAYLDDAERAGFAWEFLRRDPDYRLDYERMGLHLARETSTELEVALALAKRWGLKFPV